MTVNAQKRNSRLRRSARTGRRTKLTGFSTKSFFAGIAVGILGTIGVSLVPSLIPGSATSSQPTDNAPGPDSSPTRYEFWETLPTNDVAVNTDPYEMSATKSAVAKEYLLQAGSFRKQDEADALRAELILAGFAATTSEVTLVGEDRWFRVLVGPYTSRRETRKAMSALRTKKISALVLERPSRDG